MRKANWLLIVLALMLSAVLVACSGNDTTEEEDTGTDTTDTETETPEEEPAEEEAPEQVLNILEGSQIPTMDSSHATDAVAFQFLGESMEGLYRLDENAQPTPGIAAGEPEISEDGLTWTIQLREDAVWSNGDPVTAHDFVFAWRRAVNPDTGSEYGPFMMNGVIANAQEVNEGEVAVEELGVEATSDTELVITLAKPVPYFYGLLTFGTFLPLNEAFVTEQGADYALSSDNLIYNGPFLLQDWNPTGDNPDQWSLVKNPDYWDAETVTLEQINVSVVKETSTAVNLYETGDTDRAGLSAEYVEQYAGTEDFRTMPEAVLFYLKMNQSNEALANQDIRKAIAMSIGKQDLVDVILANGSVVSTGAVPQNFSAHPETGEDFRELNGDLIVENKETAKEHWAAGLEALGTDTVELRYLGGDSEVAQEMDAYIKNQLEGNLEGLTVTISSVPFEERIARDEASDYDIQNSGWGPDYLDPNTWLEMWTTSSPYMTMNYNNEEFNSLIEQANNELLTQPVERFETFLEAEKVMMEDAAIAPLYQRSRAYLWRPGVEGVVFNPMGADFNYKWAHIE
ncbi:peptide ABC transporter substrate-binding protein [Aquibacillus halophilus]|uniref:Peptide ABC transporter substrate-binding protein n=1 Tax=Aquibacillus halophilus TaxID=930132 RepID=A0A6A8DCH8_9BACI|nr:peptide ABC transporter substrate-binding protein [Aquibacillus halophilus]MRH43383.1 peptide ABC transporter substrate-binding protein [Aquibacillus halophilus]